MTKEFKHPITATVRVEAMRAAGLWYDEELKAAPGVRDQLDDDIADFFAGLLRRSSPKIRLERSFAEDLVERCGEAFISKGQARLLLTTQPLAKRGPVEGLAAVGELVCDIAVVLRRGKGRPPKIYPLEGVSAVIAALTKRKRGDKEQAVEMAAAVLGVSVTALETAYKKGKVVRCRIQSALGNVDPLLILTNDGSSGVAIVRERKDT